MSLNRALSPASPLTPILDVNKEMATESGSTASIGIQHYDSAPDLRSIMENITERKKRKIDECDTFNTDIMKDLFTLFSQDQAARFNELQATINSLKEQNCKLTQSVELMSNKYDDFIDRISKLEFENKAQKKTIESLEEKMEFLERKSRSTGIEIRNVPKKSGETKQDLCKLIERIGQTVNIQMDGNSVKDIYRIKSKDASNPIVVELSSVLLKENILGSVKSYNKSKKPGEKLNTTSLSLQGPKKPVYISETLTAKTQKLFYLARLFQQQHNYSYCWTSHGVIYLRKREKDLHFRITSESDIESLRKTV